MLDKRDCNEVDREDEMVEKELEKESFLVSEKDGDEFEKFVEEQKDSLVKRVQNVLVNDPKMWSVMEHDILEMFLSDFKVKNNLSREEEMRLLVAVKAGDAEARKKLVYANLRLVFSIAKKYQGKGIPLLDLLQEGCIGLLKAIEKKELEFDFKFSTYAVYWIKSSILHSIENKSRMIRIAANTYRLNQKVLRVEDKLRMILGRNPSSQEVADELRVEVKKIDGVKKHVEARQEVLSLNAAIDEDESKRLENVVKDPSSRSTEEMIHEKFIKDNLEKILKRLSPREKVIIEMRFGLRDGVEYHLWEIGEELGISAERVRVIIRDVLEELKVFIEHNLGGLDVLI